jgi:hypothetical protein
MQLHRALPASPQRVARVSGWRESRCGCTSLRAPLSHWAAARTQIRVTIPLGMVCGDVFSKVSHAYPAIACTVWVSQMTHMVTAARLLRPSTTLRATQQVPAMHTATACPMLPVGRAPAPVQLPSAPPSSGKPGLMRAVCVWCAVNAAAPKAAAWSEAPPAQPPDSDSSDCEEGAMRGLSSYPAAPARAT